MKRFLTMVALSAFVATAAQASPQLAKANNCFKCHSVDAKIIGPAFHTIAQKYKGESGAELKLADRIRKGAVGVWGSTPMTAYPDISDADLKTVVKWVLAQ